MPWGNTFRAALLDHAFRGATSPRQDTYYVRLQDAGGNPVDTGQWTNYTPLPVSASAASSAFAPAADPGDGSRESVTSQQLTFSESPEFAQGVTQVPVRFVELATAASGGMVVFREQLPVDIIVQAGMPVRIPAGQLAAIFSGAGV